MLGAFNKVRDFLLYPLRIDNEGHHFKEFL
jgi:hypothetical protein